MRISPQKYSQKDNFAHKGPGGDGRGIVFDNILEMHEYLKQRETYV